MKAEDTAAIIETNQLLKEQLLARLPQQNRIQTDIEGLVLSRRDEINKIENCFYYPTVGVVLQGSKRSMIGNTEYQYGAYHCMVAGVDIPSINQIIEGSVEKPFLALSIKLDKYLITQLMTEGNTSANNNTKTTSTSSAMLPQSVHVSEVSIELLDAFLRLVNLLNTPQRISVLAPMIIREIHYYLLTGAQGDCLRMVCASGTKANRIAQAISWLRENYTEPLNIERLASRVNMASSSFHRHFRKVTTLSPLQFQKRLRLYEAERLMLTEGKDALTAALNVGYESATQFNREYKRQFGEPPHRDIFKKRLGGMTQPKNITSG